MVLLAACGGEPLSSRTSAARQALSANAEVLELETIGTRQALFQQIAQASLAEAGRPATPEALFPLVVGGAVLTGPGFDPKVDLLQAPDAGPVFALAFDGRAAERWPEDRRQSLQGLSEREAAELVARTLLSHWGIQAKDPVSVERAAGAPYAVAYVDGILRINPSFLYLAAAASPASSVTALK